MKVIKRTKKLKVDQNNELGRTVLQTFSTSRVGIMEPINLFHAQKDSGTEIIPFYLVISS